MKTNTRNKNHKTSSWLSLAMLTVMCAIFFSLGGILTSHANSVTLDLNGNSFSANGESGGEFVATTSDNGIFDTFCVDPIHEFTTGTTYSYQISQNTGFTDTSKLSLGAAYLYSQFLNGNLNGQLSSVDAFGQLVYAIWYFNGEAANTPFNFANDTFITYADNNVGSGQALCASDGAYGIAVMNLYDGGGNLSQSQLIKVANCPDTTSTLAILGACVLPLGLMKMRANKGRTLFNV